MGNTMGNCPMCKSANIDQKQPGPNTYYECNKCGYQWHKR